MLVNFTEWLLTLVTVTVWGAVVSPICRMPKFRLEVENYRVSGEKTSAALKTTQQTLVTPLPPAASGRPLPSRVVE